jgi:hypothetical protein
MTRTPEVQPPQQVVQSPFHTRVETIRDQLRENDQQQKDAEGAPVPLAEAKESMAQAFVRLSAGGEDRLRLLVGAAAYPQNRHDTPLLGTGYVVGESGKVSIQQAESAIAFILREHLIRLGSELLEKEYEGVAYTLPARDRRRVLADLAAKRFALEVEEEAVIEEAEAAGVYVPRRPDATPEAVLGIARNAPLDWDWFNEKFEHLLIVAEGTRGEIDGLRQAFNEAQDHLVRVERQARNHEEHYGSQAGGEQMQGQLATARARVDRCRRRLAEAQNIVHEKVALATNLEEYVKTHRRPQPAHQAGPIDAAGQTSRPLPPRQP